MESTPTRICVPVCVQRASELGLAIERAHEVADIVEVRLDYLGPGELEAALQFLRQHLKRERSPMILTFRPSQEGGRASINYEVRVGLWATLGKLSDSAWMDLELDLTQAFDVEETSIEWSRVICSHHDFRGVPPDLDQVYEQVTATPARIVKIAVQANDATDCLPIFDLLERAKRNGREMIAIAMGQAGIMTRILGPSRGSFLTYGAFDDQSTSAPGQPTATELRELYRIDRINEQTEIVGLIGNPVIHSFSGRRCNSIPATYGPSSFAWPGLETARTQCYCSTQIRRDEST
jgi:3-dehydroquinate dehydratase/shikimate dehydrogenase